MKQSKDEKEIQILKNKLDAMQYELNEARRIIKDAWWILTDIDFDGLSASIYVPAVHKMLYEIASEVLEEERAKND